MLALADIAYICKGPPCSYTTVSWLTSTESSLRIFKVNFTFRLCCCFSEIRICCNCRVVSEVWTCVWVCINDLYIKLVNCKAT